MNSPTRGCGRLKKSLCPKGAPIEKKIGKHWSKMDSLNSKPLRKQRKATLLSFPISHGNSQIMKNLRIDMITHIIRRHNIQYCVKICINVSLIFINKIFNILYLYATKKKIELKNKMRSFSKAIN